MALIQKMNKQVAKVESVEHKPVDLHKIEYIKSLVMNPKKSVVKGSLEEVSVLDSELLMLAPRDFFKKYERLVEKFTSIIQGRLSAGDSSHLIALIKEDPTNREVRENGFYAINREFLVLDNNPSDSEYLSYEEYDKRILLALIVNEIVGLGPLEPLFRDDRIQEIICNGPYDIQVDIGGVLKKVESCQFRDSEHLQNLITRLYSSVNRDITRMTPFGKARLHDNSRIHAVHQAIAPDGPNLNIRRHVNDWVSPEMLLEWGSTSEEVFEWLGQHINAGLSFVVNGATSTGKTTMLASLCGFLPNNQRILTIEKNLEIKLPKSKLLAAAMETIPAKTSGGTEVTMRDLVECCTQMRPDIIICGEVVGDEAYDLIQAANTGHQVSTSIHSNSSKDCMYRLMSLISQSDLIKGKQAFELIASGVDFIVTLTRFPQDGSRKITEIAEVGSTPILNENGVLELPVLPIWQFKPDEMRGLGHQVTGEWVKVGGLSMERQLKHNLPYQTLKSLSELQELYRDGK